MARSNRARPGISAEYGSARARDIARYGVKRRDVAEREAGASEVSGKQDGARTAGAGVPTRGAKRLKSDNAHARTARQVRGRAGATRADVPRSRARQAASQTVSRAVSQAASVASVSALQTATAAPHTISLAQSDALEREERKMLRRKVIIWAVVLIALLIPSLGIYGASTFVAAGEYVMYNPLDVLATLWRHLYNFVGVNTHLFAPLPTDYDIVPFYKPLYETDGHTPIVTLGADGSTLENGGWGLYDGIFTRLSIIAMTLVCAVLLSVSGMLYQNVFKNPLAGPGMLGVSSGVSLGMVLLVYVFGIDAFSMLGMRYGVCYSLGAAILVVVIFAGRRLSGAGESFDIVTMLLIGSILSQLIGFIVTYVTMFVMDPEVYQQYITLSQMLVVDTSGTSWIVLLIASVVSLAPVVYLRFRFNALAFDEQEVKLLGINFTALRAVALICGAIMILAAQIHIGAVAMVSLIVPFVSRSWFGCEFRKQLVGNVCVSTVFLLLCRDIVDLIPFVGDGIGIGSAVSVMALPVFLLIMARNMRGWE